jgi:UDP-3-O-[3-hydroxymyristoyl] glucosamine N-acyltransferase
MSLNLQQLADALQLEYRGDADLIISGVASARAARSGDLCFLQQKKHLQALLGSACSAVIVTQELSAALAHKGLLLSQNPQYSLVQAIRLLDLEPPAPAPGIHPSAQVADSARIASGVSVGACAVIEDGVEIGADSVIGAGSIIESAVRVGSCCHLHSRVTLGRSVRLGDRCVLHSGAVIGADGFGLIMHEGEWCRIPQLGTVVIEDDVEIGANTTVDRGALDDTVIEQGCKLDNQIQVAHNVRIGAHTAIAACVGIAGSATIGRYCKIAGSVGILGHLTVADHVTVTAMSLVTKDIKKPGVYSSGTPLLENRLWHRANVRYKGLDKLARAVAILGKPGK